MKKLYFLQAPTGDYIRVLPHDGQLLLSARDIARMLGYRRPDSAVRDHCHGVQKFTVPTDGGMKSMGFLTENETFQFIGSSAMIVAPALYCWLLESNIFSFFLCIGLSS